LDQSTVDVRVLIIDDASPDNTAEVAGELVREDRRIHFIRHESNRGHIDTYNEGIECVSADYMLLLSADDYLLPGALDRAAELMDQHPEVGFTFGKAIELHEDETLDPALADGPGWRIVGGLEFIELCESNNIVSTATAVVRTELQKRLGGYRRDLPHSGDLEMWFRFGAHASVGILDSYQAIYRRHQANMSLDYMAQGWLPDLQQRKSALDWFFQTCSSVLPNSEQLRRRLFWSLGCTAVEFAGAAFDAGDVQLSGQLSDFAGGVCPQVKRSTRWAKLVMKRQLGVTAWRALRPTLAKIRRAPSR
jgi:glycosyltransferase involved in cell wall biosynthesis